MDIAAFVIGVVGGASWGLTRIHPLFSLLALSLSVVALVFGIVMLVKNSKEKKPVVFAILGTVFGGLSILGALFMFFVPMGPPMVM